MYQRFDTVFLYFDAYAFRIESIAMQQNIGNAKLNWCVTYLV